MSFVTVLSNYRITLPKELRVAMHIQPGQKFELIPMGATIQLVPKKSIKELKSAVEAGVASGQGRPADKVFDRLKKNTQPRRSG